MTKLRKQIMETMETLIAPFIANYPGGNVPMEDEIRRLSDSYPNIKYIFDMRHESEHVSKIDAIFC